MNFYIYIFKYYITTCCFDRNIENVNIIVSEIPFSKYFPFTKLTVDISTVY